MMTVLLRSWFSARFSCPIQLTTCEQFYCPLPRQREGRRHVVGEEETPGEKSEELVSKPGPGTAQLCVWLCTCHLLPLGFSFLTCKSRPDDWGCDERHCLGRKNNLSFSPQEICFSIPWPHLGLGPSSPVEAKRKGFFFPFSHSLPISGEQRGHRRVDPVHGENGRCFLKR